MGLRYGKLWCDAASLSAPGCRPRNGAKVGITAILQTIVGVGGCRARGDDSRRGGNSSPGARRHGVRIWREDGSRNGAGEDVS
jgi:hypothetical protein